MATTLEQRAARRREARIQRLRDLPRTERIAILDWFYRLPLRDLRAVHKAAVTHLGEAGPPAKRKPTNK